MIESKRFWFKKNALKYAEEKHNEGKEAAIWQKYFFKSWVIEVYEKWTRPDCESVFEVILDEEVPLSYMEGIVDENAVIGQKDVDGFVSKANASTGSCETIEEKQENNHGMG